MMAENQVTREQVLQALGTVMDPELHKDLVSLTVDDPGCVYDIDRPTDLAAWKGDRACATSV